MIYLQKERKIYKEIINSRDNPQERNKDKKSCWNMPLEEFHILHRRFRLPKHLHKNISNVIGEGIYEDGVALLCNIATKKLSGIIVSEWMRLKALLGDLDESELFTFLKRRTGLLKMGGSFISPYWRWYCYWETLAGYKPPINLESFKPEIKTWLMEETHLGGPLGVKEYSIRMYDTITRILDQEWYLPRQLPTAIEWSRTGVWMKGKSGTESTTQITVDNVKYRTRRIKGVTSVFRTDEEIAYQLNKITSDSFHVHQKPEAGKVRGVVKTGNAVCRKMDYLSEFIENGLLSSKRSTLFAGTKGNESIDIQLMERAIEGNLWMVPLDQSKFDQKQSKETVLVAIAAILDFLVKRVPSVEDIRKVGDALWESIAVNDIEILLEHEYLGIWKNGLPSGWRWTALLGTLLNLASFDIIKEISVDRMGFDPGISDHFAQGDDVIFSCPSLKMISIIMNTYKGIGYEVHPEKTFISKTRGEFLRRSYEPYLVTGYITRSLLSIRFKSPEIQQPTIRVQRLHSRLENWHLITLRGGDVKKCVGLFLEDAVQMGIERKHAANYTITPSSVGGGGVCDLSKWYEYALMASENKWMELVIQKKEKIIHMNLGPWDERMKRAGIHDKLKKGRIMEGLAKAWGIPLSVMDKESIGTLEYVRLDSRSISGTSTGWINDDSLVEPGQVWDKKGISSMLIRSWKETAIEDDTWRSLVKPEFLHVLDRAKARMSKDMWKTYMLGEFDVPMPLTDSMSVKYGFDQKKWAREKILKIMNIKDIGRNRFMYWLLRVERVLSYRLCNWANKSVFGV